MRLLQTAILLAAACASSFTHVPSGTYSGHVKKLGEKTQGTITIKPDNHFDGVIQASGLEKVDITCPGEQYVLGANGIVTLPTVTTKGDCLHDGLEKNTVKLKKVVYDADKDTITLYVHKIIDITIVLHHQSEEAVVTASCTNSSPPQQAKLTCHQMAIASANFCDEDWMMGFCCGACAHRRNPTKQAPPVPSPIAVLSNSTAPSGTYFGKGETHGVHLQGTVNVTTPTQINIDMKANGKDIANCPGEAFTIGPQGYIQLPGKATPGDCLHDNLKKASVQLKSVHYNAEKDTIKLILHHTIDITIVLHHQAEGAAAVADTSSYWARFWAYRETKAGWQRDDFMLA